MATNIDWRGKLELFPLLLLASFVVVQIPILLLEKWDARIFEYLHPQNPTIKRPLWDQKNWHEEYYQQHAEEWLAINIPARSFLIKKHKHLAKIFTAIYNG